MTQLELDGIKITDDEYEKSNNIPRINLDSAGLLRSLPRVPDSESFTDSPDLIYSRKLKRKRKKTIMNRNSSADHEHGESSISEQKSNNQQAQSFQDEILTIRSQMGENWLEVVNGKLLNSRGTVPEIVINAPKSLTESNDQNDNQVNEERKDQGVKTSTPINMDVLPPLQMSNPTSHTNKEQSYAEENFDKKTHEDQVPRSVTSSDPEVDFYINSSDSDNDYGELLFYFPSFD